MKETIDTTILILFVAVISFIVGIALLIVWVHSWFKDFPPIDDEDSRIELYNWNKENESH